MERSEVKSNSDSNAEIGRRRRIEIDEAQRRDVEEADSIMSKTWRDHNARRAK